MTTILISILTLGATLVSPKLVRIGGHDGVEVYQNKTSGPIIELAAMAEFDAPPAQVQAVLLDYGAYRSINRNLTESVVLERKAGEQLVYQHLTMPMLKDRDFTLRVVWAEGRATGLSFSIDPAHGPAPSAKAVRMSRLTGQWVLKPIRGGRATQAYYHLELDLSGGVPRWMVSGGAAKDLPNVFVGVRRLLGDRRGTIGPVSSL
jgi:Polyketide cyclase / dehydrase and lipid transport